MRITQSLSGLMMLACSIPAAAGDAAPPADAFMAAFEPHCGQAYQGRVVVDEPSEGDNAFTTSTLVMHVAECGEQEIRIPFFVGDDRSRTWVLTVTPDGLRLKHDHRHEDGSEDAVTWYGGTANEPGTATRQAFPVDTESVAMFEREGLVASVNNVWAMEIEPGDRFMYELSRPSGRLFQVEFDLSEPVATPPLPWGAETVADPSQQLVWAAATNGEDIKWREAVDYCADLELAGHDDWRLPSLAELETLHQADARGGESIRSPFSIGGCCLWSNESLVDRPAEDGDEIGGSPDRYQWGLMFDGKLHYYAVDIFDDGRALCVREPGSPDAGHQ